MQLSRQGLTETANPSSDFTSLLTSTNIDGNKHYPEGMNGEEALVEFHVDLIEYNVKLLKSMVKPPEFWEATIKAYPDLLTNVINVSDFRTHHSVPYFRD